MANGTDLELAKAEISSKRAKLAFVRNGEILFSSEKGGVVGLVLALGSKKDLRGTSAADTVVGLCAARLLSRLGVSQVFGERMSGPGEDYLRMKGIGASYGTKVQGILNRTRDGPCPFELIAKDAGSEEEVFTRCKLKLGIS